MKRNRATPRIWHTDWLLLRALARRLREQAERHIQPNTFMIDFGCGDSPYAEMMRQLNINYCGADLDDSGTLKIDPQGRIPLADGAAGAILSVQVLEHVRDLDAYCAEIRRLLNDDGLLLLSTHGTWLYHPHPEDHRRWTRTGLISDLTDRGFVVEEVDALVGPLATTTIIRLTGFAFFIRRLPLIGGILASSLAVMMNLRAMFEDYVTPAQVRHDNACVFLLRARKAPR
ncbi:methyltransferase domain-containing protein [Citrobacter amalonaticus]|uniref:methyltransferase domain-containing protein n=1 Tax=Citrobacter amalonaticus TaxID=35703 RepID=UPI0017884152|nr:methyltransferase domain-containing protein [Citrobacter amalonaticus]MBE0398128.1 methyltransferase domain-containing protein [Citrobacter amalonaticus]